MLTSAVGLRETCPPSGRTWAVSSASMRSSAERARRSCCDSDNPISAIAMAALRRGKPGSLVPIAARSMLAWRSSTRTKSR